MCLAIPSKVITVDGILAVVERYGERLTVSLTMLPEVVEPGDYVIVQARSYAVQKLEPEAAREVYRLFDEIAGIWDPIANPTPRPKGKTSHDDR